MKPQIDELLRKEMSRKEFLQHIGSGMLVLFGISGLVKALVQPQSRVVTSRQQTAETDMTYGLSAYGGLES